MFDKARNEILVTYSLQVESQEMIQFEHDLRYTDSVIIKDYTTVTQFDKSKLTI